jgi:hypothetical protein
LLALLRCSDFGGDLSTYKYSVTQLASVAEFRPRLEYTKTLFYALFNEFFFNAPYKFTQLTNLRHLIFALGLFGWCIPFIEAFFSNGNIFYFGFFPISFFFFFFGVKQDLGIHLLNIVGIRKEFLVVLALSPCRCNSIETPTLYIHDSS